MGQELREGLGRNIVDYKPKRQSLFPGMPKAVKEASASMQEGVEENSKTPLLVPSLSQISNSTEEKREAITSPPLSRLQSLSSLLTPRDKKQGIGDITKMILRADTNTISVESQLTGRNGLHQHVMQQVLALMAQEKKSRDESQARAVKLQSLLMQMAAGDL